MDYPNSKKAKKIFLCLFVGGGGGQQVPKGLVGEEGDEERATFERRRERERRKSKSGKRSIIQDRDWILRKKEVSVAIRRAHTGTLLTCFPVVSTTRQGRRSTRFEVHSSKTAHGFLIDVLYLDILSCIGSKKLCAIV